MAVSQTLPPIFGTQLISSGVQTTASGPVTIVLRMPFTGDSYSMDVLDVGKMGVKLDFQKSTGSSISSFDFNVPTIEFKVRDEITNETDGSVDSLMVKINSIDPRQLVAIEITVNSDTSIFYATQSDFKFSFKDRNVDVSGFHPLKLAIGSPQTKFDTLARASSSASIGADRVDIVDNPNDLASKLNEGDVISFGDDDEPYTVSQSLSDRIIINETLVNPVSTGDEVFLLSWGEARVQDSIKTLITPRQPDSSQIFASETITVYDFIEKALQYYGGDDSVVINSVVYKEQPEDTGYGTDVIPSNAETNANAIALLGVGESGNKIPKNDVQLNEVLLKLSRMDGAYFGSLMGSSFYVCRGNKVDAHGVDIFVNDVLDFNILRRRKRCRDLTFGVRFNSETHAIFGSEEDTHLGELFLVGPKFVGLNFFTFGLTSIEPQAETGTLFPEGDTDFRMVFDTLTSFEEGDIKSQTLVFGAEHKNADSFVADGFYRDQNLVARDLGSDFFGNKRTYIGAIAGASIREIVDSYIKALDADGEFRIAGTINGIDKLKPYQHISIPSVVGGTNIHPLVDGKDFRLSKIEYNLKQDTISFEAYPF